MEKTDIFTASRDFKKKLSVAIHDPAFVRKIKLKIFYTKVKDTIFSVVNKGFRVDRDKNTQY